MVMLSDKYVRYISDRFKLYEVLVSRQRQFWLFGLVPLLCGETLLFLVRKSIEYDFVLWRTNCLEYKLA